MTSILLGVIYLAFIGLGLPDSLLGAAWPVMQGTMGVPISYVGALSMLVACGTIASSLLSDAVTRRLGAGRVTAISVAMTAAALFGTAGAGSFWVLCLWAVPYGLGAGAVDAALNNYVALHYTARHMNWLHCFWGVGAAVGPTILSRALTVGAGWRQGYAAVAAIQVVLSALLFFTLPLWRRNAAPKRTSPALSPTQILRIPGARRVLVAFFSYCALETTAGLWASSYLVVSRGVDAGTAARYASLFYLGITAGRFACGLVADRLGDRRMIQIGVALIGVGIAAVALPVGDNRVCLYGLLVVGLGCAPVYPAIIHATPRTFGAQHAQAIIGVQMASAYLGASLAPPLFGLLVSHVGLRLYPAFLLACAALLSVTALRRRVCSFDPPVI